MKQLIEQYQTALYRTPGNGRQAEVARG
jgi:hypothetical protein